ncbi:MAG TPA: oxidoreductase [Peptococcaceae bacterium]|nr:oxidoreductase [Peptococcaceae bacterium]
MKVFVVDVARCNGCYNCQIACKDEHVDNDWAPYAKPQPDIGHFWLGIKETEHGQIPKVKIEYKPILCMHCAEAPCLKAANDNAVYRREDGLVLIDPVKAVGQKQLVEACPYGKIYWNEELQLPQKCTGCAHLLDQGLQPRCVEVCPTNVLRFGEEEEFKDLISQAEVLNPELGLNPRVYYLNLPKLFIGGEVYDSVADECLQGVTVTLTDAAGKTLTTQTDHFGDFWFRRLEPGVYSLKIEMDGCKPYELNSINLDKSLNVGAIALR